MHDSISRGRHTPFERHSADDQAVMRVDNKEQACQKQPPTSADGPRPDYRDCRWEPRQPAKDRHYSAAATLLFLAHSAT